MGNDGRGGRLTALDLLQSDLLPKLLHTKEQSQYGFFFHFGWRRIETQNELSTDEEEPKETESGLSLVVQSVADHRIL